MARYNEILVGRFARAVQKLFGMKGEVPVGSLAGELSIVHGFQSGVENRYLEGWDLFAISLGPTGGAAQSAAVRLRNPSSSNAIIVVHGLIISGTLVNNVSIVQMQPSALAGDLPTVASVTNSRLDARTRPQPTAVPSQSTNYGAIPAVQSWNFLVPANSQFQLISDAVQEIPLLPGATLDIINGTAAQQLIVSILWRERFLEESERA